jgi:hypothetical protein
MKKTLVSSVVSFCLLLTASNPAQATMTVSSGWDLLTTQVGTTFEGASFVGVPVGNYNFGGTIGVQNVGDTDTIIQRLQSASPSSPTISLQMDALQLETAAPVSLGGGPLGNYFITLQSARGGPVSLGSMTISFGPNTFVSSLDVFFDVRYGSLNGPIVQSGDLLLSSTGTSWGNVAPAGALLINGVNHMLDGTDIEQDFWPAQIVEQHPNGATHVVAATTPEPTTMIAGALLLLPFGASALRSLRKNRKA